MALKARYEVDIPTFKYVSESDILGPNDNLSDIKNLVSFERVMFKDTNYIYRIKNPIIYVNIPTLKTCLKHHKRWTCQ